MDATDRKILEELKSNGRVANKQIARKLDVSEGTVRNRINGLVNSGVIRRFTVETSTNRGFMAFVLMECDPNTPTSAIVRKIIGIEDVEGVYETAGRWDIIARVNTESGEAFNDRVEKMRQIPGVRDTETIAVLKIS